MKPYQLPTQSAHKDWLFQLAQQLPLSATALEAALNKLGILPNKSTWLQWLTLLFLALGSGLFLSGVLFFFAYNWEELHRFSRFAILLSAIIITAGATLWTGIDTLAGKLLLTAAAVLTGVVLATFGMVYQTGADSFMLFRAWFFLILPWVLVSRFQPLWFIAFVIANTAVITWMDTMLSSNDMEYQLIFALSVLSVIFLLLRELTTIMHPMITEARWLPRVISCWLLFVLSFMPFEAIVGTGALEGWQQGLITLYVVVMAALSYHAFIIRRDLFILAALLFSGMTMLLTAFAQLLQDTDIVILFLLMGLAIAGATTVASKLLLGVAKQWKAEEQVL